MCVQGFIRKISRLHGVPNKRQGQPREDSSQTRDDAPEEHQGSVEFERKGYGP